MTAAPGARRLYIYYRVPAVDAALCCGEIVQWQRALCAALPGLQAELLRRPQADAQALATLMETYAAPQGIDDALQARIETEALAVVGTRLIGARHTEVFVACA